jgi:hypothetical protein
MGKEDDELLKRDIGEKLARVFGGAPVVETSKFIQDMVDATPRIECGQNIELLTNHLNWFGTSGLFGVEMTDEENWQTTIHSQGCPRGKCNNIYVQVITAHK